MKILLTGKSDFTYNRTRVLISGLEKRNDVELIYYPIVSRSSFNSHEFTRLSKDCDLIYIPPFRHSDVKFIKKRSACPVVFDALISKYLTRTIDHGKWWTGMEKTYRDKIAFKNSDFILMDTQAHKKYIVDRYKLQSDRVWVLPVGVDTDHFMPIEESHDKPIFKVGFYGGFIPLQGVDKIVKAAAILKEHKDIQFDLIGKGPRYKQVKKLASKLDTNNINFSGWLPYDSLNERINEFDLCLGIFGDSLKANLVVPNKVYHYAALRKCILTKDTIGIKEIFEEDKNIVLTSEQPDQIAEAILALKNDLTKREKIAKSGFNLVTEKYNHHKIANIFIELLQDRL